MKIYLAGKMSGLTFEEMNSWRAKATELLKEIDSSINVMNPCLYYNFTLDKNTYTEHEVKTFDLWLVKNSDIVLINTDYPDSIGTAIEIHEAHDNWKIPVIGFGTQPLHPWMELCLNKRCETLEDAVQHINDFYIYNL